MNFNDWGEKTKNVTGSKILLCGLLLSCVLYITSTILAHNYDWDIDQFMYFGSRLANGEMAFVREFDDKSIALHTLFVIPYWLKSINLVHNISRSSINNSILFYKALVNYEKGKNTLAAAAAMYFTFLITSTRGGINHINGIAACMTLACISVLHYPQQTNREQMGKKHSLYI